MNRQCVEKVDPKKISFLVKQDAIYESDPAKDVSIKAMLHKYSGSFKKTKKFTVTYRTSKNLDGWGRVYPFIEFGKGGSCAGLAMFGREVRAYLSENYIDIDMKRAHWYILRHLFTIHKLDTRAINDVLKEYDTMVSDGDAEDIKRALFSALYSCPSYMNGSIQSFVQKHKPLARVHELVYGQLYPILKEVFPDLFKLVKKQKGKEIANLYGSFISHVLQHHERLVITRVIDIFDVMGLEIGAIIHDGVLVSKESAVGKDIQKIFQTVFDTLAEEYCGLECYLIVKSFPKVREEWPLIVEEEGSTSSYGYLCDTLINHVISNNIQFDEYSVYQKSATHPMVYEKIWDTHRDYIVEVFVDSRVYKDSSSSFSQMCALLREQSRKEIKYLKADLNWVAFRNGAFNIETALFVPMDKIEPETAIVARHYLDFDFDPLNFETPLMDSLVGYQTQDEEALKWVYIFIARLFFPPDNDAFQVMPYFYGLNNTGKSTIAQIVKALFPDGSVASLNSNQEQTFGLDNFLDKQALITSDAPQDLKNTLSVDLWKSMVSGEMVNVARKNQKAKMVKWIVPQMMASNYLPNWNNTSGAVSKRLALFIFNREVVNKSSELPRQIIRTELGAILNKCIKLYGEVKTIPKTFVDFAPEYFKQTMGGYCESVDTLFQFLNQTDSIDKLGTTMYQIDFDEKNEDYYELLSVVEYKYQSYVKHMRVKDTWIKGDYSVFGKFGCKVEKMHICKACSKRAGVGCCSQYDSKQRKKLHVVKGLKFITVEITGAVINHVMNYL